MKKTVLKDKKLYQTKLDIKDRYEPWVYNTGKYIKQIKKDFGKNAIIVRRKKK